MRRLGLTTPLTTGEDVKRLQKAINARLAARGRPGVTVDGQFGVATERALRKALWFLGCPSKELDTEGTPFHQGRVLHPELRGPIWLRIARDRQKWLAKSGSEADELAKWMRSKVGMHETPINSNRGHDIDIWNRECGLIANPYCAMFIIYGLRHICAINVPSSWCYTPAMLRDVKAGKYGFKYHTPRSKPKKGWIAMEDFVPGGEPVMHVETTVVDDAPREQGDDMVGANTSKDYDGSQDQGGGVYFKDLKVRKTFIVGWAEPPYGT